MKTRKTNRAGFTLAELIIVTGLIGLVLLGPVRMFTAANDAYGEAAVQAELAKRGRIALNRAVERLQLASPSTVTLAAPDSVDFQPFGANAAGTVPLERIALEPSPDDPVNGLDDDGDGLTDERRLVWIQAPGQLGERRSTLTRDVPRVLDGEVPNNGIDDNGNGQVDEPGLAMLLANLGGEILNNNVDDDGDGHVDEANGLTLQLTLVRVTPEGRRHAHTLARTIAFRNRD